ncbi:hypothetical protein HanXRQr2_Chr12g0557061 [Helianthus annuus]|uniref:Uncharacterized protein n=1 Tax=Helianthus annuus TaxID=4232 RepID=A0A9K3MXW8_HELAN|nr:hypothetical protein HanXRQr2_Chr12g0557061 [Helianthus annuus]KAJ0490532.1 hypothetical protein HanHA300_Chr12g0456551 [Helianthus annuus]KAJ0506454.1 hypothetical protein HanHA89_Chr12g0482161 [Helianthus annuus]KAJ0676130.1 hypothetical protein HanLR1_Chr12g0459141 [Helianthus annuus]
MLQRQLFNRDYLCNFNKTETKPILAPPVQHQLNFTLCIQTSQFSNLFFLSPYPLDTHNNITLFFHSSHTISFSLISYAETVGFGGGGAVVGQRMETRYEVMTKSWFWIGSIT